MIDLEQIRVPAFSVRVAEDGQFRYIGVNAANAARSGLSTADVVGRTPHDLFAPDVADRLCGHYRSCMEGQLVEYEVEAEFPAGRSWWRATIMPVAGAPGESDVIVGTCHSVRARRLQDEAAAAKRHLDLAIRCLKGADWRHDVGSGRYEASDNLALLLGEAKPRPVPWEEWARSILPEDAAGTSCDALLSGAAREQVVRFRFRDVRNEVRWAQCRRIVAAEGRLAPVICGVIVDVTDERRREIILEQEARRDSLTGLLNRRGFRRELDCALARPGPCAVLMLDLNGFKPINDRFGHAAGDAVLVEVGRRLLATLDGHAVAARLGGDEFVAAVPGVAEAEAVAIAERLDEALRRPLFHDDAWIAVSACVGLSWRDRDVNAEAMMSEADEHLYEAKRRRRAASATGDSPETAELRADQMSLFAA